MRLPEPHTTIKSGTTALRFYLGDCLDVLPRLPRHGVDAIVTSPPYNLGIAYRSYDDTMPRADYLRWTTRWVHEAAGTLDPNGSLFLNVGAKPTDPWIAMDVAQAVRTELRLQNTIHWVKSIAIDREAAGGAAGTRLRRDRTGRGVFEGSGREGEGHSEIEPGFLGSCTDERPGW